MVNSYGSSPSSFSEALGKQVTVSIAAVIPTTQDLRIERKSLAGKLPQQNAPAGKCKSLRSGFTGVDRGRREGDELNSGYRVFQKRYAAALWSQRRLQVHIPVEFLNGAPGKITPESFPLSVQDQI